MKFNKLDKKISLVVTTISKPNKCLRSLARGCIKNNWNFIVIGDASSPNNFNLKGSKFFSIKDQLKLNLEYPKNCHLRSYARKNIGYLISIMEGAEIIVETDDDNFPTKSFWNHRQRELNTSIISDAGWINVYKHFSVENVWPRGLPLEFIHSKAKINHKNQLMSCPIQQGLADDNPDVDAIYRLVFKNSIKFKHNKKVALSTNSWSPFNSQNTTWFKEVFPLLYLPSTCSFRMTDIWRSFIAQRIAWANKWPILFHSPTVYQVRNPHNLMKDFNHEIDGYIKNNEIKILLENVKIKPGLKNIPDNMKLCYEELINKRIFDQNEMKILYSWFSDLKILLPSHF